MAKKSKPSPCRQARVSVCLQSADGRTALAHRGTARARRATCRRRETWPTQPFPTAPPPFTRHDVTTKTSTPFSHRGTRERWVKRMAAADTECFSRFRINMKPSPCRERSVARIVETPRPIRIAGLSMSPRRSYASVYKLKAEFPFVSAALKTVTNRPPPLFFPGDQLATREKRPTDFFARVSWQRTWADGRDLPD